jgi:hypothetical protein
MNPQYIAERFFRRRGDPPTSIDGGFLPDPTEKMGRIFAERTITIQEAAGAPCLVVLGEPGIGKSTTMQGRRTALGHGTCFVDLKISDYDDVSNFSAVQAWLRGECHLNLVIDTVEMGLNVAHKAVELLANGPAGTLHLELACRAKDWSPELEGRLQRIFGEKGVAIVFIEPLRRRDAAEIARVADVEPESFLRAIAERDLGPLAGIPITLQLLLLLFKGKRSLPRSTSEVYFSACQRLCSDPDVERKPAVDVDRRLDVACAVAALTVFSARWLVAGKPRPLEGPAELTIDRLVETLKPLGISRLALEDVLGTGLFSPLAGETWGWYHQTLGEFLASRWLASRELEAAQLRQLLFHPDDPEFLVPTLASVASWLAASNPIVGTLLAKYAPEYFVTADCECATDQDRKDAVDALLRGAERLSLSRCWWRPEHLRHLTHPGLAAQLDPFLLEGAASRQALQIASANQLAALTEKLCAMAESPAVNPDVRAHAVRAAVGSTAEPAVVLERLRRLAEPGDASDPYEEVRAAVLDELWPEYLAPAELFRLLTRPREIHHFRSYQQFIFSIPTLLRADGLCDALAWVVRIDMGTGPHESIAFEKLSSAVCALALEHMDHADVPRALAKAVLKLVHVYKNAFKDDPIEVGEPPALSDANRRRALLAAVAEVTDDPEGDAYHMLYPYGQPPFVVEDDVGWLLGEWQKSKDPFWSELIRRCVIQRSCESTLDAVLEVVGNVKVSPLLPFSLHVELESDEARETKRAHAEQVEFDRRARARGQDEETRKLKRKRDVEDALGRAFQGDLDSWWQVVAHLWETRRSNEPESLQQLLAWNDAPADRQRLILETACAYLIARDAQPEKWLAKAGRAWRPAVAGYLSLRFVADAAWDWVERHQEQLAQRWCAAVVGSSRIFNSDEEQGAHRRIMKLMFTNAHRIAVAQLQTVLRRDAKASHFTIFRYLPVDDEVAAVLERFLVAKQTEPSAREDAFEALLRYGRFRALAFARRAIAAWGKRGRPTSYGGMATWGERFFRALFADDSPDTWSLAWELCQRVPAVAKKGFVGLGLRFDREPWGEQLSDETLAALFVWMRRNTPSVPRDDVFDDAGRFRDSLLSRLANRGAVDALAAVLGELPKDRSVLGAYADAVRKQRERTWQPLEPEALVELTTGKNRRLVESDVQLLDIVMHGLAAYEEHLQGGEHAAIDLWNYDRATHKKERRHWPKDENDFSDHIARYLRRVLAATIVDREVEIRPARALPGQRTDVLVQAAHPREDRTFGVVVEIKCAWNRELEESIDTQLCERYLFRGQFRCGIYCVGWFLCRAWDARDGRMKAERRRNRTGVSRQLIERAEAASTGGRVVRVVSIDASL